MLLAPTVPSAGVLFSFRQGFPGAQLKQKIGSGWVHETCNYQSGRSPWREAWQQPSLPPPASLEGSQQVVSELSVHGVAGVGQPEHRLSRPPHLILFPLCWSPPSSALSPTPAPLWPTKYSLQDTVSIFILHSFSSLACKQRSSLSLKAQN